MNKVTLGAREEIKSSRPFLSCFTNVHAAELSVSLPLKRITAVDDFIGNCFIRNLHVEGHKI